MSRRASQEAIDAVRIRDNWEPDVPDELIGDLFVTHMVDLRIQVGHLSDAIVKELRRSMLWLLRRTGT
jgi:hypothetical protein